VQRALRNDLVERSKFLYSLKTNAFIIGTILCRCLQLYFTSIYFMPIELYFTDEDLLPRVYRTPPPIEI